MMMRFMGESVTEEEIEVRDKITINVPLFKKLRDIIFFFWDNNFVSHLAHKVIVPKKKFCPKVS